MAEEEELREQQALDTRAAAANLESIPEAKAAHLVAACVAVVQGVADSGTEPDGRESSGNSVTASAQGAVADNTGAAAADQPRAAPAADASHLPEGGSALTAAAAAALHQQPTALAPAINPRDAGVHDRSHGCVDAGTAPLRAAPSEDELFRGVWRLDSASQSAGRLLSEELHELGADAGRAVGSDAAALSRYGGASGCVVVTPIGHGGFVATLGGAAAAADARAVALGDSGGAPYGAARAVIMDEAPAGADDEGWVFISTRGIVSPLGQSSGATAFEASQRLTWQASEGGGALGSGGGGAAPMLGAAGAERAFSKTDRYGIFVTSERAASPRVGAPAQAVKAKDDERSHKWLTMREHWDALVGKKGGEKLLKKRARKGIPDTVRGEMWQLLCGSKTLMAAHPGVYDALVASHVQVDGPIEEDIPRTMFDHEMFCNHSHFEGHGKLRRVLLAFGRRDREVQYCQGINYIAALFLLYMTEEEAFWLLACVMQRPRAPLRELFLPGMLKAREFHYVMDGLALKFTPRLHNHLKSNDIDPTMYAHPWFMTCFTQSFPYDLVTRVWDIFLKEDWKIMYRVCLALFKSVEDEVCALDLERANMVLRKLPAAADASVIMDLALRIPLKHKHIEKRVAKFYEQLNAPAAATTTAR